MTKFLSENTRSAIRLLMVAMVALLLDACASVTAEKVAGGPQVRALPAQIFVKDFLTPTANLHVDRTGEALVEFKDSIAYKLAAQLAKQLDHNLAPTAVIGVSVDPRPQNAWLVVGRFDRIEQGSRALRAVLGFGLGATKVETTAEVYDISTVPPTRLMTIKTTGGSNAAPGTVINLAPFAVAGPLGVTGGLLMGAGTGALPGLSDDLKRTAREITATISEYCYQRGLIPEKQAMHPKESESGAIRLSDPARPQ